MEHVIDASEMERFSDRFQYILDVRSPCEFEEDHMPGAINVPVLSNAQREEVGLLYQQNPFEARKLGGAYAVEAIARFLKSDLVRQAGQKEGFLIYCARGGQRSASVAAVLSQIGFPVFRLERGYKSWRKHVLEELEKALPQPVYVLYGHTGSRKTELLHRLADRINVIDLEGCAQHKGSLLGNLSGQKQPTQRAFETAIFKTLRQFKANRPTLIEGESRRIGACTLPDGLWSQMRSAKCLWLETPLKIRTRYIVEDYCDLRYVDHLKASMKKLSHYLAGPLFREMSGHIEAEEWDRLVEKLLTHHYDPLYERSGKGREGQRLRANDLDEATELVVKLILDGD